MDNRTFKEEEFPYHTLEQFALSQEMIEDLPMNVLDDLKEGRRSPLLPIHVTDDDGNTIHSRSRFKFYRKEDGSIDVLFYPQLLRCNLEQYSEEEQKAMLEGKTIVSVSPTESTGKYFVQIDQETNQVMYIPTPVIGRNLRSLMEQFHLTSAEIQIVQNGEPLTFLEDDELVTVGIDLNEKTGIRMVTGDIKRWEQQRNSQFNRYNFGLFGCWVKDENGLLDYIHEDEYTDEIWEEQKKVIAQNSAIKR